MNHLEAGMMVRIKGDVHDTQMPRSRCGILLYTIESLPHYSSRAPEHTNIWVIQMTNGVRLKFHSMHLEPLTTT